MTNELLATKPKSYESIFLLLIAGLFAHIWLIFTGLRGAGTPMGDILFAYQPWVQYMIDSHRLLGINADWVYPYPAMIPMWASALINPNDFQAGWLTIITALNLLLLAMLANFGRRSEDTSIRFAAAWFWLFFLVALGPVSISRVDAFSVGLALLGVLALQSRKLRPSTVWFTVAASMKIWPAGIIMAALAASKYRRHVFLISAATALAVLGLGYLLGGNASLFSFLSNQTTRGLQIESVIASLFLWAVQAGLSDNGIYYDTVMMTFQVSGNLASEASSLMTLAMAVALGITAWLASRAARSGAKYREIMPVAVLTATLDLIVFNKVGSPQFVTWLAVPIILGLLFRAKSWRLPMFSSVAIALLSNLVYPIFYDALLAGNQGALALLTLRNVLYVALLVWANIKLSALTRH